MTMNRGQTARGFNIWEFTNQGYEDEEPYSVSVQDSSLAERRAVWVGPTPGERMHLTEESARNLRDALTEWLSSGDEDVTDGVAEDDLYEKYGDMIRMDVFTSGSDKSVRLIHIPTGTAVAATGVKTAIEGRRIAIRMLQQALTQHMRQGLGVNKPEDKEN